MAEIVNTPDVAQQFFNLDGKPLASGYLKFFKSGTDIPASVYTSDGETALGPSIQLDASGFPVVQFSLITGQLYTVKAFDHDDVLLWTRNDISGSSEGGGAGNWVPMEGVSVDDPITGPLVWKNGVNVNNTDAYGTTLTSELGGATSLVRDGLSVAISNSTADYGATSVNLQNTQNGFPGYPDYALMNLRNLQLHREIEDSGRKEKSLSLSVDSSVYNMLESKGAHLNVKSDKAFMVQAFGVVNLMGHAEGTTPSIELNPTTDGVVYVGNNGSLVTKRFGIGTSLNNKEVNDIWTSTSTGAMTDDQLITAKAAYDMSGGGGSDWHVYKYEPRPIAPVRLSWDPAGQTNKTLCWVDVLPPGLTFSKVYLFPDSVSWGDNMKTAPDRYGWAVYRRKKIDIRTLNRGETYSKNACSGQFVNGFFEITSTPVSIPDDEYVYFIGIMVSSFYQSSYSLNINLIGTDPVDYHNWSGIGMPAGAFTDYTDLGPSIRGYATDGTMVSLPDNYIACGNYNTSPYNQRISFPWWACK